MLNNSNKHPPANTTLWLTVAYAMVLVYVTLHPVGAIRWTDAPAWGFVFKPWSKFGVTGFDVWINVLAYLPLGFGLAWLLGQSRVKRWGGKTLQSFIQVLLALMLSAGLSFLLESLQSYSPVRVASTWDVVCNAGGALVGILFAVAIKGRVSWIGRLLNHIIGPHRGALWAVIGLWGLAQMHPQGWSFMTAPLALVTEGWMPVQGRAMPLTAMQLQNLETIASVVALSGMLSLIRLGLHKRLNLIERSVCLLVGLVFIFTWQTFSYSLQYGLDEWQLWANEGVMGAMGFIALAYAAWSLLPAPWVAVGAVMSLALHTALAQMLPQHPYIVNPELWQQGRLIHLYALTSLVSAVWPILALAALVLQSRYFESSRHSN